MCFPFAPAKSPVRLMLAGPDFPRGSIRPQGGGYIVPAASDPTVASRAWAGRGLQEDKVIYFVILRG